MANWTVHWLEAEGTLAAWKAQIAAEVEAAEQAVRAVLEPPPIDILIAYRREGRVIPELGLCGFAYSPSMFLLACDPDNPSFDKSVTDGALKR